MPADVVYSFMTFNLSILGPDGQEADLGFGAGMEEGGVRFQIRKEDQGLVSVGADGKILHSLTAVRLGGFTAQCQKNSKQNQILMNMFNLYKGTPSLWGQMTVRANDSLRGDVINGDTIAFTKPPEPVYGMKAEMMQWEFVGNMEATFGAGPA